MAGIFISYRRADSAVYAAWLHEHLAARFGGDRVFIDVHDIKAGDDFVRVLNEKLGSSVALVALIGPKWAGDDDGVRRIDDEHDFVRLEVATALARKIRVIPALLNDAAMPAEADLPSALAPLRRCNAVTLTDTHFHGDAEKLAAALEEVVAANDRSWSWRNPRLRKTAAALLFAAALGAQQYIAQLPAVTEVAPHFNPASAGRGEELVLAGVRSTGPLLAYEGRLGEGVDVYLPRARLHPETLALLRRAGAVLPTAEAEVRVTTEHAARSKTFFDLSWGDPDRSGHDLRIFQLPEPTNDRAHFDVEATGAPLQLRILGPSHGTSGEGAAAKRLVVGDQEARVAGDIAIKLIVPERTGINFRFWTLTPADAPGAKAWFDSFALGAPEMRADELPPLRARSIGVKAGDSQFALIACAARRGDVFWSGLGALTAGRCTGDGNAGLLRVTDFKVGAKELQMRVTGNGWVAETKDGKPASKDVLSVWEDNRMVAAAFLALNLVLVLWLSLEFFGRGMRRMLGKAVS